MAQSELRSNPPIDRPRVAWPSAGQIVRQLIIAAVVVAIWAAGLAAYVRFTGGPDKVAFVPAPPTPTVAPLSTATPTLTPVPATEMSEARPGSTGAPLAVLDATSEPPSPAPVAESTAGASSGPSFAADVMPFFNKYCIRCHGSQNPRVGLSLATHAAVLAGSRNGSVVKPGDAAASELARVVISGEMPPRGEKPTEAEIQILVDWINGGALDN